MRKLILTAVVLALTATTSTAGPIRNAVARLTGRGCGGCQPAAQSVRHTPQQYTPAAPPPVTMPQTGNVHLTSYTRSDAGPVAAPGYTPIRVGGMLPTVCGPNGCGR